MINDIQEQIDHIMDHFDFEQVHETMKLLDWKWGIGDLAEIPDIPRLRATARRLIKNAIECAEKEEITYHAETGGFRASCMIEDNKAYLQLDFVLTSWNNHYD